MSSILPTAKIRPFRPDDAESAAQILQECPQAASWPRASHEKLIGQSGSGVVAFVWEADSLVTGFLVARQVADQAEVLNMAVRAKSRRSGQGSALLLAAFEEFQRREVSRVFLEVRESNTVAITFYRKHGFIPAGRRKGYYRNPQEDAVLMEKELTT
jgi:ribosomal-protein-alanine N-acetyltransferase